MKQEYRHMNITMSKIRRLPTLLLLPLLLIWGNPAHAQAVGKITNLSGVLTARHPDGSVRIMASKSDVMQGDTLITQANTYARIKFVDNAEIVLRPASELIIKSYQYDAEKPANDKIAIGLTKGSLRAVSGLVGKRNPDAVSFDTPAATIGIRGTHFGALFCQNDCGGVPTPSGTTPANGLHVDVAQGAIVLTNPAGSQVFQSGQFGFIANMNTPPVVIPPTQGIPLTMPLSISKNAPSMGPSSNAQGTACIVR
ncbi:FecR family protein [Herminiimonas arsenitoxidans]|uniref:FecR family protein n=1 Tax=Herminiimonas arsenitoxidans TaxID=1809410 RepID=UPI000970A040|nr:FecR family protein [Herminiimonas arsenitoxidans]